MRELARQTCSHLQPLEWPQAAASKWPQVAASGRTWPGARIAFGHLQPLETSGRKWPQVGKWPQVAASGRKWPQVAASGRKWPQVAASGRKWPGARIAFGHLQPLAAVCSDLQPLAATRVTARGREQPQVSQVAAVAASGFFRCTGEAAYPDLLGEARRCCWRCS